MEVLSTFFFFPLLEMTRDFFAGEDTDPELEATVSSSFSGIVVGSRTECTSVSPVILC